VYLVAFLRAFGVRQRLAAFARRSEKVMNERNVIMKGALRPEGSPHPSDGLLRRNL